jgi:hypothetical protein
MRPACSICGKPMRLYGQEWKCMTSEADHRKITHAGQAKGGSRGHGGWPKGRKRKKT